MLALGNAGLVGAISGPCAGQVGDRHSDQGRPRQRISVQAGQRCCIAVSGPLRGRESVEVGRNDLNPEGLALLQNIDPRRSWACERDAEEGLGRTALAVAARYVAVGVQRRF